LLAVDRQVTCWKKLCPSEAYCTDAFFDCSSLHPSYLLAANRASWMSITNISTNCDTANNYFNFGIYVDALNYNITTSSIEFMEKYFYCVWMGLLSLSSLTQTWSVSTYIWEIIFTICIIIVGLLLFAFLIGNMQTYLQSLTLRLEEMRVKRRDTEQWMKHRQLPREIVERVRRFDQYKWVATRGVDEEVLVQSLPLDLRRDIKRHLCLDLVRRVCLISFGGCYGYGTLVLILVFPSQGIFSIWFPQVCPCIVQVPLFDQMDDSLLDAMCERLKPALNTEGTYILREEDPVNEMLFIIRGKLESSTTNGGRTGFLNVGTLGPGDFCGEELLTWALDPKPSSNLPTSTRTVKALVEVEAFALFAEDLKFVAGQFRRLHSKQLQHTFRFLLLIPPFVDLVKAFTFPIWVR
jgi:cyclic nucleotide gated channel